MYFARPSSFSKTRKHWYFGIIISVVLVQQTFANEDSRPEILSMDSDSYDYYYDNDFSSVSDARTDGASCLGEFHYGADRGLM